MGCDIHAYIDYDNFTTKEGKTWVSCWGKNIDLGRNYTIFTLMAGVRHDKRIDNYKPLFDPRGLPHEKVSFTVTREYTSFVDEGDHEDYVNLETATKWVANGYSKWWGDDRRYVTGPDWHSASYLYVEELKQIKVAYEALEFATSSWLQSRSPDEQPVPDNAVATKIESQFNRYKGYEWYVQVGELKTYPFPATYEAVISAMEILNDGKPERSRLVFWFDN